MPSHHPRISTEIDRRAYEALENISRRAKYQKEIIKLERLKDQLSVEVTERHKSLPSMCIAFAINKGRTALHEGRSYQEAIHIAETHIIRPGAKNGTVQPAT